MVAIKQMMQEVHANACEKGWWGGKDPAVPLRREGPGVTPESSETKLYVSPDDDVCALLALVDSELSEALECIRDRQYVTVLRKQDGKPEGFPSELADTAIRIFDVGEAYGCDLEVHLVSRMLGATKEGVTSYGAIRAMIEEGFISFSIQEASEFCQDPEPYPLEGNEKVASAMLFRVGQSLHTYEHTPDGLVKALVDCLIGVMFVSVKFGFNLETEIEQKFAYNEKRSHKHGGKTL